MNIPRLLFLLLLIAVNSRAQAADNATPPAAEPAPAEIQTWIASTDAQWRAAFQREVTDAFESELGKAKAQYAAALETAIAKASGAGDLAGAVALRDERNRFSQTGMVSEQDEPADLASVKDRL